MSVAYNLYVRYDRYVVSRLQRLRSDETRAGLIAAARALFSERGFANTSTEQVVNAAGVTRGALYHHFNSKEALFREVFVALEEEFVETARHVASPQADAWANLAVGCHAFLDACLQPDVQRIMLLDGPSVLGPDWRLIEERYALRLVVSALERAMRDGTVARVDPATLGRMLLAAINEAGLHIAQAEESQSARREAGRALDALLSGLRCTTTHGIR